MPSVRTLITASILFVLSAAALGQMPPPRPKAAPPTAAPKPKSAVKARPKPAAPAKPKAAAAPPSGDMVRVPAGSFLMGCNAEVDSECDDDEKPGRQVSVAAFQIDRTEVSVAQYRKCADAGACSVAGLNMPFYKGAEQPGGAQFCNWGRPGRDQHPINCLDWQQAKAYCQWAGKRLPTEAEWEKAARGTDGRKYPWGNTGFSALGRGVANIADESAKRQFPDWPIAAGYDDGYVDTAPVGSYGGGASPYGAQDMIGNVWEWLSDEFSGGRAVRGGSWDFEPRDARASNRGRNVPGGRNGNLGVRCAQ